MQLKKMEHEFSVCQIADTTGVDLTDEFCFLGKTDQEISLVCITQSVPSHTVAREDGWKGFRIQGVLDFSLVGILSRIATLLAENQISIFAISTYDTDYIFTKSEHYDKALDLLEQAGYSIC